MRRNSPKTAHVLIIVQAFFAMWIAFNYSNLSRLNWGKWVKLNNPYLFTVLTLAILGITFMNLTISFKREREHGKLEGKIEQMEEDRNKKITMTQNLVLKLQTGNIKEALTYLKSCCEECNDQLRLLELKSFPDLLLLLLEQTNNLYDEHHIKLNFEIEDDCLEKIDYLEEKDLVLIFEQIIKQITIRLKNIDDINKRIATIYVREEDNKAIIEVLYSLIPYDLYLINPIYETFIKKLGGEFKLIKPDKNTVIFNISFPLETIDSKIS